MQNDVMKTGLQHPQPLSCYKLLLRPDTRAIILGRDLFTHHLDM